MVGERVKFLHSYNPAGVAGLEALFLEVMQVFH